MVISQHELALAKPDSGAAGEPKREFVLSSGLHRATLAADKSQGVVKVVLVP